jgi:hypothetical protein
MIKISMIPLLFIFTIFANCFAQDGASLEESKIQFLLNSIEKSKVVFIRNGEEHTGPEARKHLEKKMNYARKAFWLFGPKTDLTVMNFISKVASSSSMSKKKYQVRLRDGTLMTTGQWLRALLKKFNQNPPKPLKK